MEGISVMPRRDLQPKDLVASTEWAPLFGFASFAVTLLSSIWLAMCFTAREAAWWNALDWWLLFYGIAALLGLFGIRSLVGLVALLSAVVPLGFVCIFVFGR